MKEESSLLKEFAKLRDIISLGVCVGIYQTCNGIQFNSMPASDFVNFLYAVSCTIEPANFSKHWVAAFLNLCGISLEYYKKHHKDFLSIGASEKNKEYRERIDEAIKRGCKL